MKGSPKDLPQGSPKEGLLEERPEASAAGDREDDNDQQDASQAHSSILVDTQMAWAEMMRKKRIWINLSNCKHSSVRHAAALLGLKEVSDDEEWTLLWTDSSVSVDKVMKLKSYQKINHFPGMDEICRKDLLSRNLNRMLRQYPEEYKIFPKTWCLPFQYPELVNYCRAKRPKVLICKPNSKSQGRGIFLTQNIRDVQPMEDMICQVYIPKPFILDGFKFDIRLYVLITSCDPLRVYVYNEGLIRFATTKYSEKNLDDMCMHLTNYAINKHSKNFIWDENKGSKRKLSFFNRYMESNDYDLKGLWSSIEDVVIKTILSAYPALKHNYITCFRKHVSGSACFQILGFDILLDHTLKPWLLEVNNSPSFTTDSKLDHEVKDSLLYNTLCMINLPACDRRKVVEEERQQAKERLLDIRRSRDYRPDKGNEQTTWVEQMEACEDKNMGNFRRIYPSATSEKYAKFLKCKHSLFKETIASKAREEYARLMRMEIQQREQDEISLKAQKFPEKNQRGDLQLQKNPTRLIFVKPKSPEELQTSPSSPSSTPTIQVLEIFSSSSQDAGSGEKNVGHSSELSPGRADVEPERVSNQNADGSEHCSLLQNLIPAEQEEPDLTSRAGRTRPDQQTEIPAEIRDGNAESEAENQLEADVLELEAELEAHSGAQAVQEESQSHQMSSESSSRILSGSVDKVNQEDLPFQPETCHQSQSKAGVQARAEIQEAQDQGQLPAQGLSLREAQDQGQLPAQGLSLREAQDQGQLPAQGLSLREAQDQGQLPAQGLIQREFQDQPLQELHDQPDTGEGTCDQTHEEVCNCDQAEAQHQVCDEDTQSEFLDLVQKSTVVEEAKPVDTCSTAGNQHAASKVINKLSKVLKRNHNQVGPEDVNYSRGTDAADHANLTEEILNTPRDQCDSCCSCWGHNRFCCVTCLRDSAM